MISFFMWAQEGEVKDSHVLPSGFVMRFDRMGGYAGVYDSFWIYPDGQVINALGKMATIPPDIVRQWLKTITPHASPPLSDALMESSTESLCFDCFVYLITICDKDGTRTLKLSGPLKDSDDVAKTFSRIRDRLLRFVWSPLMGAPVQAQEQNRGIKRDPIKVGGNVQESKLIYRVEPVYPEQAKSAQLSGRVIVLVTVNEEGLVSDVTVVSGDPILADSAVTAVKQWRYRPTLLNGEPVPVMAIVTVIFSFTGSGATVRSTGGQVESANIVPSGRHEVHLIYIPREFGGIENPAIVIRAGPYVWYEGRQYYTVILGISAPQMSLNGPKLRALANQGWPGRGIDSNAVLLYHIYISETGEIAGIRRFQGPQIPEVEIELAKTRVVAPARIGSDPIRAWVAVEIAISLVSKF